MVSESSMLRDQLQQAQALSQEQQASKEKSDDDLARSSKSCIVTCLYQAKFGDSFCYVTVTWCKNFMNHSLTILVENASEDKSVSCKIDLKPWQFWSKKGLKSFNMMDDKRVEVFWDFRAAKYSDSSEPHSDYYVALVFKEEVILLLGDLEKDAFKRTKARPSTEDASLVYRKENVFGKKCFFTKAMFIEGKKDHHIIIENSLSGPGDPEMWISVDGKLLLHVMNLQWKFRGNETLQVHDKCVQVFWDVHDWVFSHPGSSYGLFIFKPSEPKGAPEGGNDHHTMHESVAELSSDAEFSHFVYAWKTE